MKKDDLVIIRSDVSGYKKETNEEFLIRINKEKSLKDLKPTKKEQQFCEKIKLAGFLSELTTLTNKYGLKIHGCGCCGSPLIYAIENEFKKFDGWRKVFEFENLKYHEETARYVIEITNYERITKLKGESK